MRSLVVLHNPLTAAQHTLPAGCVTARHAYCPCKQLSFSLLMRASAAGLFASLEHLTAGKFHCDDATCLPCLSAD